MLTLLLPLVLALAPVVPANYAPTSAACPATLLQSYGSPLDGSQTLAERESAYITNRRSNVLSSLWSFYLSDTASGSTGYDTSNLVPRVSIAVSGGGYRAALFGAGTLSAFDSRNSSSIAPLLQLTDYISGLSGGSWVVTSLAMNDMPDLFSLVLGSSSQVGWKADHNIVAPASGLLAVVDDGLYRRALSFHFFNSTTDDNFYDPTIPHDNALLFSDIQYTANFESAALPFPIVVTTSRVSVDDQTDAESPFTVIPITNTQFEITPYTFGSFDPTLAAHVPVENAGTRLIKGALPSGTSECTIGFENAGFVIGSSAALFNGADDLSDLNTVPTTSYTFESADNQILELTDGGEDSQNIPFGPLLVKARAQDMIMALDASADDENWPTGVSLSATQNRTAIVHGFYDFPPVPSTTEEFLTLGLTTRPTFFGCNTTGNGDTSVLGNYPLVVYLPNSPTSIFATNTSSYTLDYSDADQLSFLEAAQTNAIRGYTLDTNGVDSLWPPALKCATVERARKRAGLSRSSECQILFDTYCYADGVVESAAATTTRQRRSYGYPPQMT
ncbi:hypothetical protein RQP46_001346 [Phenoliferia psychrophenolica]